jgi:hypothetical protein
MSKILPGDVRVETREISDADSPPAGCPHCGSTDYVRESYHYRDLQELGEPDVVRRVRYEEVYYTCNACGATFRVPLPHLLARVPYMPGVVAYATARVLNKGDSARRVADDLQQLHHVDVTAPTVQGWVDAAGGKGKGPEHLADAGVVEDFSGVLGVDGTFRSVRQKKSVPPAGGSGPLLLSVTHLADGRLAVYWLEVKPRKKSRSPSGK